MEESRSSGLREGGRV
ncbi:mCG122523, isoform CRA_a [Mus musculus]|nr:mCG122523, isoform CRA_a [Mus musculus]